jgi:hypothetical protein
MIPNCFLPVVLLILMSPVVNLQVSPNPVSKLIRHTASLLAQVAVMGVSSLVYRMHPSHALGNVFTSILPGGTDAER